MKPASSIFFALRPFGQQLESPFEHTMQIEVQFLEGQFAGFNLGEIQDVIDHREQRVAAGANGLGKVTLLIRERGIEQEVGHPDHPIHGRANFMAHVGQEIALGTVGRFGGHFGVVQLHFGALLLGDFGHHDPTALGLPSSPMSGKKILASHGSRPD